MSEELKKLVQEVGAEIQSKLDPIPGRKDRISYAHIFGMIQTLCGDTYSKADPKKVKAVVEAIRQNPNGDPKEILAAAKIIKKSQAEQENLKKDQQ